MANPNDNLRRLYQNGLKHFSLPDFDTFQQDMKDEQKRRRFYTNMQKAYSLPDFDTFSTDIGAVTVAAPEAASASDASLRSHTEPARVADGNGDSGVPQPQVQPQRGLLGQTLDAGLKAASDASLRSHTEQPGASASVRPTVVAPSGAAQPQGWEDSPERQAFQMKVNAAKAGLKTQGDDFQQQIEGIQKGNKPGASKGELEIDPHTGRMDTAYYTAEGDRVDSRMQQSRANSEYHQWWENNREAGQRSKEQRLQHEFEDRVKTLWLRHDLGETGNAAQRAWTAAEAEYDSAVERNRKNKAMISGVAIDNTDAAALSQLESVDNFTDRLTTHDLDALMDNAWKNLGSDGQKSLVDDCYRMLSQRYQGADDLELYNYAKEMARQQSDLRMYRLAVEKNLPKGKLDYFMRKVGDMNLLTNIGKGIAVNRTGKTGDMAAYEAGNEEYRQDGHTILDVAGTVVGFAFDPTMLLSGGVGGAAARGALWAGGRYMAGRGASAAVVKGASREFAHTLTGRIAAGVVGGSANFGTFEGIKEMENQFAHGGKVATVDENGNLLREGRYVNEGYSASAVGGQALHGLIMGGAIGWLGPVTGNVSDKLVKGTTSTAGKVATRSGLYAGATVAEGTIFSVPEWYEGNRDGFDVWTDNMAMMVGFKAKHMLKSAGGVLGDLKASFEKPANGQKNRMDFASRLRMRMDAPSDGGLVTRDGRFVESLALTKDEAAELSRYGYRDLRELVESSERTGDASKGALITANAPEIVSRLTDMVRDTRVSEAARAKMYYYATGRKLPMSMMMRGELGEDGNGGFVVKSYGANGVITSRSFKSRKGADRELERIRRQTELNSIEVGEWYQPIADFESRIMEASRRVAAKYDWRPIDVYRTFEDFLDSSVRGKDKELSDAQKNIYSKIIAELGGIKESDLAGKKRSAINEKYGVDIDKAIRKDLNRRTEAEQSAIEEYISELMPQRKTWNEAGQKLLPSAGEPRDVEDVGYREVGAEEEAADFGADGFADDASLRSQTEPPRMEDGEAPSAQRKYDAGDIKIRNSDGTELRGRLTGYMNENGEHEYYVEGDLNRLHYATEQELDGMLTDYVPDKPMQAASESQPSEAAAARQPVKDVKEYDRGYEEGLEAASKTSDKFFDYLINLYSTQKRDVDYYRGLADAFKYERQRRQKEAKAQPTEPASAPTEAEVPRQPIKDVKEYDDGYFNGVKKARGLSDAQLSEEIAKLRSWAETLTDFGRGRLEAYEFEQQRRKLAAQPAPDPNVGLDGPRHAQDVGAPEPQNPMNIEVEGQTDPRAVVPESDNTVPKTDKIGEIPTGNLELGTETVPKTEIPVENGQQPADDGFIPIDPAIKPDENGNIDVPAPEAQPEQTPLQRIPRDEKGEPMFELAESAEVGWDALVEFSEGDAATAKEIADTMAEEKRKAYEKAQKLKPKGKNPTEILASKKANAAQLAQAENEYNLWLRMAGVEQARQNAIRSQQEAEARRLAAERAEERRRRDAEAHDAAVARFEEEQRVKAEKQAEQEARGAYTPHPDIRKKWDESPKFYGPDTFITLADGTEVPGNFVYHEAFAATPSHDPFNGYAQTEGFPVTPEGRSVNPRAYDSDGNAQRTTEDIARNYDSRGIRDDKVVQHGVRLSGNGGDMALKMAYRNGTAEKFKAGLARKAAEEGISADDFNSLEYPDRSFVPKQEFEYTPQVFDIFNRERGKGLGRDESAVRQGMLVADATFRKVVSVIGQYDRLEDFYRNDNATREVLGLLMEAGVFDSKDLGRYRNGTELSGAGEDLIESVLVGKVFDGDPDAVRKLADFKDVRRAVVSAMSEISANRALTNREFGIDEELSKAIDLVYRAKKSQPRVFSSGVPVSPFGRQAGLYDDEFGESRVTDGTVLMLADILNCGKHTELRKVLAGYNMAAGEAAIGQMDLLTGAVPTKEEILNKVNKIYQNGTAKEKQAIVDAAIGQRKAAAAAAQNADAGRGGGAGAVPVAERGGGLHTDAERGREGDIRSPERREQADISKAETEGLSCELSDEVNEFGKPFVKSSDGTTVFGIIDEESGLAPLPIKLSLGENYKDDNDNNHGYGYIHIDAGHRKEILQNGFNSVEEFVESVAKNYTDIKEGARIGENQTYLLEVADEHNNTLYIQLSRDGKYWNVNSAGIFKKKYSRRKPKVYSRPAVGSGIGTDTTEVNSGQSKDATAPAGNSSETSDRKVTNSASEKQGNGAESSEQSSGRWYGTESEMPATPGLDSRRRRTLFEGCVEAFSKGAHERARYGMSHAFGEDVDVSKAELGYEEFVERYGEEVTDAAFKATEAYLPAVFKHLQSRMEKALEERRAQAASEDSASLRSRTERTVQAAVEAASAEVDISPTPAQVEAGNYKKGHVIIGEFDITIENPAGSVRKGVDADGKAWSTTMANAYGYIKGTESKDGDPLDVFLHEDMDSWNGRKVYVVDQTNTDGTFDEHKVMLGFNDKDEAMSAYLANYDKTWADTHPGIRISETNIEDFNKWVRSSRRKIKPFAEYKSVRDLTHDVDQTPTNVNEEGMIVDGDGKALTLYHGTANDVELSELEMGHAPDGEEAGRYNGDGISFTPHRDVAEDYASLKGGKGKVFEVNVTLKKPYYTLGVANFTPEEAAEFTASLQAKGYDGIINYQSNAMREEGALPNEVIVFDVRSAAPASDASDASDASLRSRTEQPGMRGAKGYKVVPKPYTNKQGKTLDTYLVTFDRDFSKEEMSALRAKAKAVKGWYDRESGGWMLRSAEDAKAFAEDVAGKSEDEVADEAPLSMSDMERAAEAAEKKGDVGSAAPASGASGASDASLRSRTEQPKQKKRKWISDEDAAEFDRLHEELRRHFGKGDDIVHEGAAGYGKPQPKPMDAEVLRMGTRMTYLMMKGGLRSFADYCEAMKDELPDVFNEMRPHLKSLYAAAQNMEEVMQLGWDEEMDDRKTVKAYDVYNFDKPGAKDLISTARHIVDERASEQKTGQIVQSIKDQRNEQRKKEADETSADTEAVAGKAEASADEVESQLEAATTEEDAERLSADIDKEIEEVNKQLALLGYYEADPVDKDFNEAYGYMRNAERKATQDAHSLATQLAADLGLTINPKDKVKKSKYGFGSKIARSNVAPDGGEVYITLPLAENRELSIWLSLEKNEPWLERGREDRYDEDLVLTGIMYRVENPNGGERYVTSNHNISPTATYDELLGAIRRLVRDYLPADVVKPATALAPQPGEDMVDMAKRVASAHAEQKSIVESDKPMEDLFAGKQSSNTLTAYDELKAKHPDTVVLMKVGDFYTTYRDDATTISNVLGVNLTSRPNGTDGKVELAGFPAELLDQYLPKLIRAGHRVALGDYQTKSPVVKRQKPTESTSDKPADATATSADMLRGGKGSKAAKRTTKPEQSAEDVLGGLFDMAERGESPYIVTPETEAELAKQREAETNTTKPNQNERTDLQARSEEAGRRGQQPRHNEPLGEGAKHEVERTDGGRVAQRSGEHSVSDTGRGAGVSGQHQSERSVGARRTPNTSATLKNTRNNHAERGIDYAPKGEKARIEANLAAIKLAKELLATGATATPKQMEVLRRYSGWGGLGSAFNEGEAWRPNPVNKQLREILTPEEYEAAVMSRNSAYYTPAPIIDAMWDIVKALGFKGGNIIEGSAGIGNIIGLMPTEISERSDIHAVEIDNTTGGILSLLYPDAKVEIQGFEATRIANGSVDLAITNVPFVTGLHVMDESGDGDLSKKFRDIHDFCIAKNVRKLREGGIGIFITSSGTLDKSQKLRNWLVGDKEGCADVVGVFRLNNQTFGGTAATSDIIVVRKRVNGRKSANAIDVSTVTPVRSSSFTDVKGKTKDLPLHINRYFIEHPEHMGGEMFFGFEQGDTYRPTSIGLYPTRTADQPARIAAWAKGLAEMDWSTEAVSKTVEQTPQINEALGEGVKEGSMITDSEGNLCIARMGHAVPLALNKNKIKGRTKEECFKDYSEIKDALADVLKYQTEHDDDAGLKPLLDRLNTAYDTFVQRYGNLNKNNNLAWLRNDVDFSSIVALETYSEKANQDGSKVKTYGKTDIFSRRVVEKESEPTPKNVKDGIIASLYKFGRIDPEYLSEQLGKSQADVKQEIIESGLGFKNPTTGQMEVSYEYLSGNVREKLRQAREANEAANGAYDANIKALEAVVPMNIPAHLIEFALGSSWVEPQLYERFIKERTDLDVRLTNAGGTWHMNEPYWTDTDKNKAIGIRSELFGTLIPGHKLIEAAITGKQITVSRRVKNGSTETTESDPAATAACGAKVDEIRQDFKDWAREQMQADPALSMRMEEKYNEKFNNSVPKSIPDEFVPEHFGGAATMVGGKPFQLRPHQAKAVIRATTQPVLLAHEVGTGKTYTLITTAMEMRRLGTARKPMIVVQNATVGQFVASAKALYPNAKVLTLEDADRNAEGRKAFYAKIKFNDWDMIVVPQSVFERIPDSIERQTQFIQDKIEEKMLVLEQMKDADPSGRSQIVRAAEREIAKFKDEIAQLANGGFTDKKKEKDAKKSAITRQNAEVKARELLDRATDDVEDFDSMGIDAILVDEAHEYKHLGFATAMQRGVKGIDPSPSKKSQGVYLKAQAVLEKTGGKNVIFATGTPISNTAAEIWTFMRYLMPADVMRDYDIYYFDDFVRNFGNLQQMLEFKTNGKYDVVNRFAGYNNLPELVRIWSTVADTVLTREAGGVSDKIPLMEGGKAQDIFLPQTRALRSVMKFVKEELDRYDEMSGKEKKENSHIPPVMYGIAKAAAVDARLVQSDAEDDPNSKTNEAARQTLRTLDETKEYKGTVAIFADNYQNKHSGFNLYEDIRKKLIAAGVPEEQVIVMKSGMSVNKKLEIFNRVNAGEVRVVLGSTFTLGTGVNIQERLHTLIHLDAPNRPMDYTQRNGRILRQGNMHNEWGIPVRVLRFGVEDSLDVTAYQRLKTKGAIADSIMNGKHLMANSMENRSLEEDQDLFGDITAQLSGSEYAMLKNQIEKEVRKLTAKYKAWKADQTYIHNRKRQIAGQNKEAEKRIADNKGYLAKVEAATIGDITVGKLSFANMEAMEEFFTEQNKKKAEMQEQVRTSGYSSRPATSDLVVSVGGFDFKIHTEISRETKQGQQGDLFYSAPAKMTYSCPELGIEAMPVKGNVVKNAVFIIMEDVVSGNDFRERIEAAERYVERNNAELQSMAARDGVPFQHTEELAQAEAKLEEYEELMKKEMEAKEAKYAELDKDVEAARNVELTEEASEDATSEPITEYSSRGEAELPITAENANFANRYETEDGKTIRYSSERGEGYGGLFDFDFRGDEAVSRNDGGGEGESLHGNDSRTRSDGLQRGGGSLLDNGNGLRGRLDSEQGEFSVVERVFTESGSFKFTSGERIESADDVAFIFSALEDAAKEHSFAVYVKDGVPTVVELGMGTFTGTMVDMPTASLAYNRIGPDEIYFVHNHPSGNLVCSAQDVQMLRKFEEMSDVPVYGVIINLKTGKYGTFDTSNNTSVGEKRIPERELPLSVHTLDKQIFARDYDPMAQPLVRGSQDVAKFLNSHRMGDRGKVSFLILSRANRIVGNIHTPFTKVLGNTDDVARYISERIVQFGGESAILYGDFEMSDANGSVYRKLKQRIESTGGHTPMGGPTLLDVVHVEGNHTRSAKDEGLLREPGSEYGASPDGDIRFREVEDETVLQEFAEGKTVKVYRTMQVIDGKLYSPMATKVSGKETPEIKLGKPEQSEEHPEIVKKTKFDKGGYEVGYIKLDKGLSKGTLDNIAYNPYIHTSRTVINDQFSSAYIRPNLVTVEVEIPQSELSSGYRAAYAKNAVGEMTWHSGSVSGQLAEVGKPRMVILSRYDKPVRIVPFREVAAMIAEQLDGTDIAIPYNVVQPQLRAELERLGVAISEEATGTVGDEPDFGKAEYITDQEIERINARQQEMAQTSAEAKSSHAERMSKKFNTPIRIVADAKELTSANAEQQARMRRSKGFYDPATGEVVVVVANNATVEDVAETVFHEVVAHKGLREMIGDENYDAFCDEVYDHLKDDLKQQVDEETTRRFMNEPGKGYEHHRRVAVDELFGRLSEKGFEDFTKAERGVWGKLRVKVLEAINKFLGSLRLPKWVRLGDNELRYMLWRSHERLRGKGDYVDMARDAAKREELGLLQSASLRSRTERPRERRMSEAETADKIEHLFDSAVAGDLKGKPVEVGRLTDAGKEYLERLSGLTMKEKVSFVLNPSDLVHMYRDHFGNNEKDKGNNIPLTKEDIRAISEVVSHPERVIFGIEPDGLKRNLFYFLAPAKEGAYNLLEIYGDRKGNLTAKTFYKTRKGVSQRVLSLMKSEHLTSVTDGATLSDGAKLPQFFENPTIVEEESFEYRFRDGETGDIWKDQSVGLEERITNAAIRLSANQSGDLTLRNDAMRAIGGNLTSLRKAMAAQKRYDQATVKRVADLARILMQNGYLSGMTSGEMQRLISAVKNSVGQKEVKESVQKIMDIMVGNQLRNGEAALRQLLSIRGSKVDARGVEVQGVLDVDGQRTMEVVKKAMTLTEDDITDRIAEALNRMSDPDNTISDQAALEDAGLNMALDYVQNIANSKSEEKTLRDSLKTAKEDRDAGRMTDDAYKQYVETTEDAIRKNKIERAEAYFNLVGRLSDSLCGSIENAKAFREAEKARVNEIHHNANSDMEGRPSNEHHKDDWKDKFVNNGFVQFLFAPLGTFDQILRVFGNKSASGEGYLWNRFMRGWVDCRNKELTGVKEKFAQLDEKAAELFGKGKTWGKLIRMEAKLPKATVSFWDGGEMRDHELAQGNLLYIYMVDKMTDGRMKLRRMGITENDITDIENFLDPRFKALGDWLQEEFLVATRNEYNETHKRMFGASMAAIENYFPLKILANARIDKEEDVNQQNQPDGITTKTGSIIKRRVNNLALDITGADALSVILDHITQMEHWSAYAEWNRDLNTLRTYKRFRNQVINMTTVYGGGRKLWENFNDLSLMAAGEYRPPIANIDKSAVNLAKGVTAAKVNFRMFTALKQLLSAPAYAPEVSIRAIAKSIANPYGDFKWCLDNMPIFRERWHSRISGDPRLLKSEMDWKMWRSRIMEISSRIGMTPNAFVDAVTVSIGARAMYETRLKQYLKEGYPADAAEKRAMQDATILFNQTQQSSESPFLSTMQVDRSWLSTLFTVFRNSSMSYTRQTYDAMRNLKRNLTPGQRARSVEFMTKQILRDWDIAPESATDDERGKAENAAKSRFRRQIKKDVMRIATFGFILEFLWILGPYLPYIFFGNDDNEKDKMWDDALTHAYFGSVEGLTGGDVLSSFGNMAASGEWSWNQLSKDMPLASDINNIAHKFMGGKNAEAINDILNLLVQSGIGLNPQSLTDAAIAITDACGDDPALSHEAAIFVMRVLQVPQSQVDKLYFDEIGLNGEEASKLTPAQLAARYAEYKVKRGTPLAPWSWDDEERLGKYEELANGRMKERLDGQGDAAVIEAYADFEARAKAVHEKVKEAKALMKTDYSAAAQAHAALQQDPDFGLYQRFGNPDGETGLDGNLKKLSKMWLSAKSPEEAKLVAETIPAYRAGIVKVLQAESAEAQQSAMAELTELMNGFYAKYQGMQPQPSLGR